MNPAFDSFELSALFLHQNVSAEASALTAVMEENKSRMYKMSIFSTQECNKHPEKMKKPVLRSFFSPYSFYSSTAISQNSRPSAAGSLCC